jgi:serine protease Do
LPNRYATILPALILVTGVAQANEPSTIETRVDGIARALEFTVTIEGSGVYGAGVLVAPSDGLVLTNWHVVQAMSAPRITFSDGAQEPGQVVEHDEQLDLALVHIAPQKRRPAPTFGDAAQLRPGEELYAIGNPRHLGFTVSRGIVSFVGRPVEGVKYVQTDLPINEGNSGGPLVNARGELFGVMSFVLKRAQGLSFALPASYAPKRFAQLGDSLQRQRREASVVGVQPAVRAEALPEAHRPAEQRH